MLHILRTQSYTCTLHNNTGRRFKIASSLYKELLPHTLLQAANYTMYVYGLIPAT